ncbi:MAG: hypothetical protein ACTJGD_06190 [Mesonia hippocampi]
MTEEQAEKVIKLLASINTKLNGIENSISPVYDASDVYVKLEEILAALQK